MNYQWTINLHNGYPLLQGMQPEEYIPPSLHTLCNHKPTMFHLGGEYLCPSKILLPPGDNGENPEVAANKKNKINDDLYRFRTLNGHQGPHKAPDLNLKKCKYNGLVAWETGERIYEPLSVLETDAPVTFATYDGWKRYRNLPMRDKHDFSCPVSPKGEMKSFLSWTVLSRAPLQALYVLVSPHWESSIKSSCCVAPHHALLVTLQLQSSIMNLHLQSSIKNQHLQRSMKSSCCVKLSLTSQSLHIFGTPNSILVQHNEFPSYTPT